jgi:hypothetical protein
LKKSLSDYIFYLGSSKQAVDFKTTNSYIINHIKKTFNFGNDTRTSLETLEDYSIEQHKPKLRASEEVDDIILQDTKNEQFKMVFKAEYDAFMKRKQFLETNKTKAYAFIWEQCAKGMQSKIESNTKFEKEIKGNPIELRANHQTIVMKCQLY